MNTDETKTRTYKYQKDHFLSNSALATEMICDAIAMWPQSTQNEPGIICAYNLLFGQQTNGITLAEFAHADIDVTIAQRKMNQSHQAYNILKQPNPLGDETEHSLPKLRDPNFIYGFGGQALKEIFKRVHQLFPDEIPIVIKETTELFNSLPPGKALSKQYLKPDVIQALSQFVQNPTVANKILQNLLPAYQKFQAAGQSHRDSYRRNNL